MSNITNGQNTNLPKFSKEEITLIGIVLLLTLMDSVRYDSSLISHMFEEAVHSLPGINEGKPFNIKGLMEKVSKLDYHELVKTFEKNVKHIVLPDFSEDERCILANCICSTILNGMFIQSLDATVYDYIYYNMLPSGKSDLSEANKAFVSKVKSLNYIQRVKLIYMIECEFFKKAESEE